MVGSGRTQTAPQSQLPQSARWATTTRDRPTRRQAPPRSPEKRPPQEVGTTQPREATTRLDLWAEALPTRAMCGRQTATECTESSATTVGMQTQQRLFASSLVTMELPRCSTTPSLEMSTLTASATTRSLALATRLTFKIVHMTPMKTAMVEKRLA